jgi:ABC-type multidrug transport system permease subunit
VRIWSAVGALVLAAGTPYCSAALGWAATQDENFIYVREDVAMGILVSWVGFTILALAFVVWAWKWVRRRTVAAA